MTKEQQSENFQEIIKIRQDLETCKDNKKALELQSKLASLMLNYLKSLKGHLPNSFKPVK